IQKVKIMSPPTNCLVPIGSKALLAGLLKEVEAEFFAASSRPPTVYRGNPFQIEVGIAYGGKLPGDELARVLRFANRVPLLYQQSACCSFKASIEASWKNYGLSQSRSSLPAGPLVIMIHMASVWVPFTSESKEAIADYDEIRKEIRLALQECGRKLGTYLRRKMKMKRESQRRDVFERYIGEIAKGCEAITGTDAHAIYEALSERASMKTAEADQVLDDEGKVVDDGGRLANDDGVIIRDLLSDDESASEPEGDLFGNSTATSSPKKSGRRTAKKTGKKTGKKTVRKKRSGTSGRKQ
ncbi:MAG TPA: DNA topoisomerase VI subunit B, partial [Phycisphaerales bacterium]|nr:DNA topoisomerase VI subunit B [Phycisphaerales bacterium]